jgi:hypothetical protein
VWVTPELLAYVQLVDAHEPLAEEEGEELLVDDGLELGDEELPSGLVQQLVVVRLQLLLQVLSQPDQGWAGYEQKRRSRIFL